jgi:hypothetical protein
MLVIKRNALGQEKIRYPAQVLERAANAIVLEAIFQRGPMDLGYIILKPGDRFVEYFYADRWYNVFVIYDVDDRALKGWYCNITRPAIIADDVVAADDLALDYFVRPDGEGVVLDEEEFAALTLTPEETTAARAALAELQILAARWAGPFAAQTTLAVETNQHEFHA